MAQPERGSPARGWREDCRGDGDQDQVVTRGGVAQARPMVQELSNMQQTPTLKRNGGSSCAAEAAEPEEVALKVAVVYQDPLTHQWADELWDRVGRLLDSVGTHRESWAIQQLRDSGTFASAAKAAAAADVVVIAVRGAGEMPLILRGWIDAWVPRRGERTGALVTLIGLPSYPDAQAHLTLEYFETVAHEAGLDFLPHERKLPEEPLAASLAGPWLGQGVARRVPAALHRSLKE
jgi:hypothetical protein